MIFAMPHSSIYPFFLLITTLILFTPSTLAQNTGNITVGTSLTATESSTPWRSPSGDFAFGFQQLRDNRNLFVLSIWFDRIPSRTIVWYDKRIDPVPRGSTVRLDATEGLVIRDPQGDLLNSTEGLADQVAYGFMNDNGNFVLLRSDLTAIWESFRNPADTILPNQTLGIGDTLISRKTPTNFAQGRFYATMNRDGNFVFNTKSMPTNTDTDAVYFNSQTSDQQNTSNSGFQVVFDERATISVVTRDRVRRITLTPRSINAPASDNYHRATLDYDGVFTQYYLPKNSGVDAQWTIVESWPDNICTSINGEKGSGVCGYNNVCTLGNQRPVCNCPEGFTLADPNNTYGDCKPNFVQSCVAGDKGPVDLKEISDTDWPKNDYEQIAPSTQDQCRDACLNDCFCDVAIYRSNSCWKKKLPLSNGRVDTSLSAVAFLKIRKTDITPANPNSHIPDKPKRHRQTLILVISVLLGSSAFINFVLITAVCIVSYLIYNKKFLALSPVRDASGSSLLCFSYKELEQATDGFKEEAGRGAFGIVYKGVMPNGSKNIVAVKKLDRVAYDSEKEFRTEVNVIGQTHHKNLVRLLGFCDEGPHRLLVYEYMSNGTLAGFLFGDLKPSWSQRTQIALGVARGLTYLHEECSTQIIHCDIKPQNILLDEYYTAKISDFGLAKLLMMNQSKTLTNIRGTKGYVAPEWFRNTKITVKVDVYSFGVVLLEIITCRKSLEQDLEFGEGENPILTDWVWDCFVQQRLDVLVQNDEEALTDRNLLERFVTVGLWCIQEDASLRPTMRRACQMLEGIIEVPVPPSPSDFTSVSVR